MELEERIKKLEGELIQINFRSLENARKVLILKDQNSFRDAVIRLFLEGKNKEAIEKYNSLLKFKQNRII